MELSVSIRILNVFELKRKENRENVNNVFFVHREWDKKMLSDGIGMIQSELKGLKNEYCLKEHNCKLKLI